MSLAEVQALSFVERAILYAEDVLAGRQVAGRLVKLAAERQLRDLERAHAGDPAFPYRFDVAAAERVCRFVEGLPHVKGEWARRRLNLGLEDWQCFELTTVFGWVHVETGLRRFRKVYEEVARKNAKSTKAAGVLLYLLTADGEAGPEVYCAATKKDQAKVVFDVARQMAERRPSLLQRFGLTVQTHTLKLRDGGLAKALDAKGSTQDGLNPHALVNDELHAWRGRDLYEVLDTAKGARQQPLEFNITTAGVDQSSICFELRADAIDVLEGRVENERLFALIYTLDKDDDWTDEKVWAKANPNLNVSVYLDDLRAAAADAKASASKVNGFLTKRMNVWCNAATAWMDMRKWDALAEPGLTLDGFAGAEAIAALDLATVKDIASRAVWVQRDGIDYLFCRHYVPRAAVESGENAQYAGWARDGWLTVTEGAVIDQQRIKADLVADAKTVRLAEVVFDPWQAAKLMAELGDEGLTVVELRQIVSNISDPTKDFEAAVLAGTLRHQNDPVLTWMVSNVTVFEDWKGNVFPRKVTKDSKRKIDGAMAAIMGRNRLLAHEPKIDLNAMIKRMGAMTANLQ